MAGGREAIGGTVGKVLTIAGLVIGMAALALTGVGLVLDAAAFAAFTASIGGITAAMLSTAAAVLTIGGSLLSPRPKPPGLGSATLDRLNITVDPNTPRKAVFGNTALATDMRDQEVENIAGTTDDLNVHRWVVMAAHKISSLDEIWFDDELVWTLAGGVVNAKYQGFLTVTVVLEGTTSNYINYGVRIAASSRRFTGCAYVYFKYFLNSESPFSGSIPTRVTLRGKAMPTYDPRKDSTVTGGSGTQRADNCSTWSYNSSGNLQGENPALQLLSWLLGWYITNPSTSAKKLSVGKGIPKDRINMASFITAANICDETVTLAVGGSERRYRAAGIVTEAEDMNSVAERWKGAMAADIDDVDGQLRLISYVNDLGAPVAAFTEDDILDAFEWKPATNLSADYNIIRGRFVNPANETLYQLTEYPPVKLTSRDGIDRPLSLDFGMVQSQSQCERLAKQWLQRAQYPHTFKAVFKFTGHKAEKGSLVTLTFGPLGLNAMTFRVVDKEYRGDGNVPMTLRREHANIYAWANNDSAVVVYADPIVYSAADTPWQQMITGNWQQPGTSAQDANLLKDATFSITYWTRSSLSACRRIRGNLTNVGQFPIDSVQSYVGEVTLGGNVARTYTYKKNFPLIVVGRLYYLVFNVAKGATGVSGTATVRGTLQFINDAETNVGSPLNVDVTLANLPAGGAYAVQIGSLIAPAGATKAKVIMGTVANTASGKVRIDNPKLLDKEPGADVTMTISGPTDYTVDYDYAGVVLADELPFDLNFKLSNAAGQITSGIAWTYKPSSGGLNSKTPSSSATAMTGAGTGTLTVSTVEASDSYVDIFALYNGKNYGPFKTHVVKAFQPAPVGSGGGSGGSPASQSSGFTAYTNTTFVAVTQVLTYTMPAGVTTANLAATLVGKPTATGGNGSWTSEGKWQRETSVGSGTWTDVGTVVTGTSTVDDEGGTAPPYATEKAQLTKSVPDTGRTAGATYTYRFVARVSAGGTRSHSVTGTASVSS